MQKVKGHMKRCKWRNMQMTVAEEWSKDDAYNRVHVKGLHELELGVVMHQGPLSATGLHAEIYHQLAQLCASSEATAINAIWYAWIKFKGRTFQKRQFIMYARETLQGKCITMVAELLNILAVCHGDGAAADEVAFLVHECKCAPPSPLPPPC